MANRNYQNGSNFERKVKKEFEEQGYLCFRTAGSHGIADVIAISGNLVLLIQCKLHGSISRQEKEKIKEAVKGHDCNVILARREKDGRRYIARYEDI